MRIQDSVTLTSVLALWVVGAEPHAAVEAAEPSTVSTVVDPVMAGADPHALVLGDTVWLYPTWSDERRGERFMPLE